MVCYGLAAEFGLQNRIFVVAEFLINTTWWSWPPPQSFSIFKVQTARWQPVSLRFPASAAPLLCCVQLALILSAHKICFITLYCQHVCSLFPDSQCYFGCFGIQPGCLLILHKPHMCSTVLIRDADIDIWLFVLSGGNRFARRARRAWIPRWQGI